MTDVNAVCRDLCYPEVIVEGGCSTHPCSLLGNLEPSPVSSFPVLRWQLCPSTLVHHNDMGPSVEKGGLTALLALAVGGEVLNILCGNHR